MNRTDGVNKRERPEDKQRGDNGLDQAISLVQSNQYKKAHAFFSDFLKSNPESSEAWLWYSRCLGNLKGISAALVKSGKAGPATPQLKEDIQKLKQAGRHIKSGRIRRCPFCWAPMDRFASRCHYCLAGLDMPSALKHDETKKVRTEVLIDAVVRYSGFLVTEMNVKTVYYLCLAHCNLNQAEEALAILEAATRGNPGIKFLADQLDLVLQHIDAGKAARGGDEGGR